MFKKFWPAYSLCSLMSPQKKSNLSFREFLHPLIQNLVTLTLVKTKKF